MRIFHSCVRMLPLFTLSILAACTTTPVGPGRQIDASESSIKFNHVLYPDVPGEYNQRIGNHNSRSETASFQGTTGFVLVHYSQSAGDTYFMTGNVTDIVDVIGQQPDKNQIVEEGVLPNTFPQVEWASFKMATDGPEMLSCVSIQRNGAMASSARAGASSAVINATECRGGYAQMGEREASALSNAVRIEQPAKRT
jgi:hypothetical protein